VDWRGLDQGQGVDVLRGVNGELQANRAAVGTADDVDLAEPQRNDEISAVGGIASH
jgi:hypothetical protein